MQDFRKYQEADEKGLLFFLPCKIGTPIFISGLISCKDCPHSKDKTFSQGYKDTFGDPYVDECEEECPTAIRSLPFSISMVEDDGSLSKGYYLTSEEVICWS